MSQFSSNFAFRMLKKNTFINFENPFERMEIAKIKQKMSPRPMERVISQTKHSYSLLREAADII
jgi:hypothetical protein